MSRALSCRLERIPFRFSVVAEAFNNSLTACHRRVEPRIPVRFATVGKHPNYAEAGSPKAGALVASPHVQKRKRGRR
jgi:hypothetical protein